MGKKQRILDNVMKRGAIETEKEALIIKERLMFLNAAVAHEQRQLSETVELLAAIPAVQEQLKKLKGGH